MLSSSFLDLSAKMQEQCHFGQCLADSYSHAPRNLASGGHRAATTVMIGLARTILIDLANKADASMLNLCGYACAK